MNRHELAARIPLLRRRAASEVALARRDDGKYVVSYVDELGRERSKVFPTRREARWYRHHVVESRSSGASATGRVAPDGSGGSGEYPDYGAGV